MALQYPEQGRGSNPDILYFGLQKAKGVRFLVPAIHRLESHLKRVRSSSRQSRIVSHSANSFRLCSLGQIRRRAHHLAKRAVLTSTIFTSTPAIQ